MVRSLRERKEVSWTLKVGLSLREFARKAAHEAPLSAFRISILLDFFRKPNCCTYVCSNHLPLGTHDKGHTSIRNTEATTLSSNLQKKTGLSARPVHPSLRAVLASRQATASHGLLRRSPLKHCSIKQRNDNGQCEMRAHKHRNRKMPSLDRGIVLPKRESPTDLCIPSTSRPAYRASRSL